MKVVRRYLPAGLISSPRLSAVLVEPVHPRTLYRCGTVVTRPLRTSLPTSEPLRPADPARLTISALSQFHWTLFIGGA